MQRFAVLLGARRRTVWTLTILLPQPKSRQRHIPLRCHRINNCFQNGRERSLLGNRKNDSWQRRKIHQPSIVLRIFTTPLLKNQEL
jgi:hypothetical protein